LPDNYHHRHQSHIYPVFPGLEVTAESDPAIYEACRIAVEKRLVIGLTSQTGWSMAHMANIYARLGAGDRALECLELIARSSAGPNLLTYHNDWRAMGLTMGGWSASLPPFQIDANFGFTAAVLEMLVFSKPGLIKLLPALPATWTTGNVRGLATRGGVTVDMQWNRDRSHFTATLTSPRPQKVRVQLPAWTSNTPTPAAPTPTPAARWVDVELPAGAPIALPES
jgi:alpha-L-fucosidase 2